MTIFHTTVTHAQNFTSHKSNERVIQQIHKDLANLQFENPEMARFLRVSGDKAKLLGTVINHVPILLYTIIHSLQMILSPKSERKLHQW